MLALAHVPEKEDTPLKEGQIHRAGRRRYVTEEWRERVTRALEETGKSKKDVGISCGVTGPYITQLLGGRYQTCRFIEGINAELGIAESPMEVDTPKLKELVQAAEDFDGEMMGELISFAETLRRLKGKK